MSTLTDRNADLTLAGLSIWVHGWQFPDADEYWDATWLYCTARCTAVGSRVESTDSFLHVPELVAWLAQCESLYANLSGEAKLEPMEPTLRATISAQSFGQMRLEVEITPDNLKQRHWFQFEADQTHVGQLVTQLRALLKKYSVRGQVENAT